MNITPTEAEEALDVIQGMSQKTRQALAGSGAYITPIVTGFVWLVGFLATQFLQGPIVVTMWIAASILGSIAGTVLGLQAGRRVRSPSTGPIARRIGLFWLLLVLYAVAIIAIARPANGQQVTMMIILFIMFGQLAMGLLLSFSAVWWALPVTALALIGYFLLPSYFYLWMAILGGGGMIASGLYIRLRW